MPTFLITTARTPNFQTEAVQEHFKFLDELRARGQLGLSGAFADQSGGAYILIAENVAEAQEIALADPLHTTGSSKITVREWLAK